jgi:hypothetical protein
MTHNRATQGSQISAPKLKPLGLLHRFDAAAESLSVSSWSTHQDPQALTSGAFGVLSARENRVCAAFSIIGYTSAP